MPDDLEPESGSGGAATTIPTRNPTELGSAPARVASGQWECLIVNK